MKWGAMTSGMSSSVGATFPKDLAELAAWIREMVPPR